MSESAVIRQISASVGAEHRHNGELDLYGVNSRQRAELERFISDRYRQVHNAELNEYLPLLLGIQRHREPVCAVGLRPGLHRPMFLEQYLDAPIEQLVAAFAKQPVDRLGLVEIGNFAVAGNGYGPLIMTLIAATLAEAGFEWMIFTVTRQVERLIGRLGFRPHYLASADANRLKGDRCNWGSYYENNPRVMAGSLTIAKAVIAENPYLSEMVIKHQTAIKQAASRLQDYRRLGAE